MNTLIKGANGITQVNADAKLLADRKILLYWDINDQAAYTCMQQFLLLNMENDKPITLLINSNGGDIGAGLLIYDAIKGSKAPVKTICTGRAYSMAAILLAAGTGGRYILPHSEVMIHEPVITEVAGNVITVEALSGRLREAKDQLANILADCTGQPLEDIAKAMRRDSFFDAAASVDFEICDRILDFSEILEG